MRNTDDFQEIAGLTIALEGAIDVDYSAIKAMMQKSIEITKQNNELQAEGLKILLLNRITRVAKKSTNKLLYRTWQTCHFLEKLKKAVKLTTLLSKALVC